jgi:hypothetical protein
MSGPRATVTRTNVLAGPAQLWHGQFGIATLPDDADVADPLLEADGWTDAGATDGGATQTVNQSFFAMRVDQVPDALGQRLTERDVQIATSLAEGTLRNLATALNHDPDEYITSGVGFQKLTLKAGQDAFLPDELSIILDGWAPGGAKRRRVLLHRCVSIENVESAYQKDGLWLYPVTFNALYVDAQTSPVEWIDEVGDES